MPPEHDRLLQSMRDLNDALSRLLVALEALEARIARIHGPSLRVVRGGGLSARPLAPAQPQPVTP